MRRKKVEHMTKRNTLSERIIFYAKECQSSNFCGPILNFNAQFNAFKVSHIEAL